MRMFLIFLVACQAAPTPTTTVDALRCVANDTRTCLCVDGRVGVATCANDVFGACACSAAVPAPSGSVTCTTGYAAYADACVNIDECALGFAQCPANAACTDTQGSFSCACKAGFTGSSCDNVNECLDGSNTCSGGEACVDESPGFRCECPAGQTWHEGACVALLTVPSAETLSLSLLASGGAVQHVLKVGAMSRVGMDFDVIGVPSGTGGAIHNEVGALRMPDLIMHGISGPTAGIVALQGWLSTSSNTPRYFRIDLPELGGVVYDIRFLAVAVSYSGPSNNAFAEVILRPTTRYEYTNRTAMPVYPSCPSPGDSIEVSGFGPGSCGPPSSLNFPAIGGPPRLDVTESRNPDLFMIWFQYFTDGLSYRRNVSLNIPGPIVSRHITEGWPSSITLFDPTAPFRSRYLVKMTIVGDRVVAN